MFNWVKLLKNLIRSYYALLGTSINEENPFQQKMDEQLWNNIRTFIINLKDLPLWSDRALASTIFGGKQNHEYWDKVFISGFTPDETQVLAKPINVIEMLKK